MKHSFPTRRTSDLAAETSPRPTIRPQKAAAPLQAEPASSTPESSAALPSAKHENGLAQPEAEPKAVDAAAVTHPKPRTDAKRDAAPGRDTGPLVGTSESPTQRSPTFRTTPVPSTQSQTQGSSPRQERKVMQPKRLFPKFWQRQPDSTDAPDKTIPTEAPMNHSKDTKISR